MNSWQCPLCNCPPDKERIELVNRLGSGCSLVRCLNCGHHFTDFYKEVDRELLYEDDVYKIVENRKSIFGKLISFESNSIIKQMGRIVPSKGSLLDFGCGKGEFMASAHKKGWSVAGIETSIPRAEYARQVYGLEVRTEPYESGRVFHSAFTAIVLFHVAEHLERPGDILTQLLRHNLAAEGIVIIEVPRLDSLQYKVAKDKWMHLDMPRHRSHFTFEKLNQFVEQMNLEIVRKESLSVHLGVLGMAHSLLSVFGYKGNIISELKNGSNKTRLLVMLVLPFALLLEFTASAVDAGGIIRIYCRKRGNAANTDENRNSRI